MRIEQIRQEEQSKIRLSTARDFHDELGHNLTRISLLSQNIKSGNKDLSKELLTKLDQISANAEQLYNGARDFIWAFDPRNDSLAETAIHLKDFGDDLFGNTEIDFQVEGLENISNKTFLSMNLRRNISLLFKEAMNNTLKHAHARNTFLIFEQKDRFLKITFRDDGQGFEKDEDNYHLGLQNMKMRAEKLNGQLSIQNNQGTMVELQLQIPQTR